MPKKRRISSIKRRVKSGAKKAYGKGKDYFKKVDWKSEAMLVAGAWAAIQAMDLVDEHVPGIKGKDYAAPGIVYVGGHLIAGMAKSPALGEFAKGMRAVAGAETVNAFAPDLSGMLKGSLSDLMNVGSFNPGSQRVSMGTSAIFAPAANTVQSF